VTTTINIGHPLFNTRDERLRIQAVLRHLGSGAALRDFAGSASEKVALVKTANQRGLIAWHKARGRYELTPAGWCELAPTRRFGVGSMMLGTTLGATLGAAALAVFWFTAGAAHGPAAPRSVVAGAPAQVAKFSAPAVTGAVSNAAPSVSTPATVATPTPAPAAPVPAAAPAPVPAAAPVEPEPTKVVQEPTPEQLAEAAAKAKQAAAAKKEKARQRAAARRKREEAARAWAGDPWRTRQAEYSGYGGYSGYRSGGYGGQNSWFAYR
jgi:outer membrane biosynthesis protein TonB